MMSTTRLRPFTRLSNIRQCQNAATRRTLIAAPKPGSGPLMSRRADRELPSVNTSRRWLFSIPVFLAVMGLSTAAIFNYQKSSSSVVSSSLYALRTNSQARQILGDEIYFASKFPWISGELNQLHGRIDIKFWVKGTKQQALMRFKSDRKYRMGYFKTTEWSLQTEDGTVYQLLESDGADPFAKTNLTNVNEPHAA
ncbi:DUF1783-domain-containing protein [Myriangium duriaei CBS 260.36]|uniref:DUF1783-domain-containing protein n=1 Tax=Myriangium duriaei CBS 260.36 TaxID=1168546 RepID=A0A9P4MQL0_9PEZI|nr:DUF1783-domain-containing protein [Myriangium duriaei CBS 260.36]